MEFINIFWPVLTKNRYIAFVPARAGSRRLPGKNLRVLAGQPLIVHSVNAAIRCPEVAATVVSTDGEEIEKVATHAGAVSLGLRPAALATDHITTLDVLRFELPRIEAAFGEFDGLVLLQPTSPLRTAEDVTRAIEEFELSGADTLTSVDENSGEENGAIFILNRLVLKSGRFYGDSILEFRMDSQVSIDIDHMEDFVRAERAFNDRAISK